MAFISLGEAVDRVLARLADQREEKGGGKVLSFAAAKCARAEGEDYPARLEGDHGSALIAKPRKANIGKVRMKTRT